MNDQAAEERLLAAINRLDDRLQEFTQTFTQRFDALDERFMRRSELMNRLEEASRERAANAVRIERAEAKHAEDIEQTHQLIKASADRQTADRRWLFGAVLGVAMLVVAVATLILTQLR